MKYKFKLTKTELKQVENELIKLERLLQRTMVGKYPKRPWDEIPLGEVAQLIYIYTLMRDNKFDGINGADMARSNLYTETREDQSAWFHDIFDRYHNSLSTDDEIKLSALEKLTPKERKVLGL